MIKCSPLLLFVLFFQIAISQQDGAYMEFYDNGKIKTEGYYKDEQRIGEWKGYHQNGQLSGVYSYDKGKLNPESVFYFDNGKVNRETIKINGQYIIRNYYSCDQLFYERTFNDGYYKEYLESGELVIESTYVDSELDGEWKQYYDTGQLEWSIHYKDGYREGIYQNFYKNGQLKLEGKMLKDKKDGEEKRFYNDGKIEWTGNYSKDAFDKYWVQQDTSGNVISKIKFDRGTTNNLDENIALKPSVVPDGLIERIPVFLGCEDEFSNKGRRKCMSDKMSQFVFKKFNKNAAFGLGLTGEQRILVKFKIGNEGEIKDIRATAPHPVLEREAIRVVRLLTIIQPGIQRGKSVTVPYTLPIVFRLK